MLFRKLFQSAATVAVAPVTTVASAQSPAPDNSPVPAPASEHSAELAAVLSQLEAIQAKQTELSNLVESQKSQIAELTTQRDKIAADFESAKTEYAKTREEITQEIKQKEVAIIAASQGVPLSEVPPETVQQPENAKDTRETLMEQYKASRDNRDRGEIIAKLKALK